jgi:hypothetical protein
MLGLSVRMEFPMHFVSYQTSKVGSFSGQKQPWNELTSYFKIVQS